MCGAGVVRGMFSARLLRRHMGAVPASESPVRGGTSQESRNQKKGEHAMQKSGLHLHLRRNRSSRILERT